MSKQRTSRLERRAEREARKPGAAQPRARRQRKNVSQVRRSSRFLPGPLANMSGTALAISIGGALVLLALVYAVAQSGSNTPATRDWEEAMLDDDPSLPGEYFPPHLGEDGTLGTLDDRAHFATGVVIPICSEEQLASGNSSDPLCYTSNPPTSGPHAAEPMPFGVLQNPAPKENLVHNMEHGGIVIWYNTDDQAVIDDLRDLVNDQRRRQRLVVMSAYSGMEDDTIAVTAWTRLDKFSVGEYNRDRVEDFIDEHHKRFNPEGF